LTSAGRQSGSAPQVRSEPPLRFSAADGITTRSEVWTRYAGLTYGGYGRPGRRTQQVGDPDRSDGPPARLPIHFLDRLLGHRLRWRRRRPLAAPKHEDRRREGHEHDDRHEEEVDGRAR